MQQGIASNADGELILKLYELRTETVMRQARAWVTVEFWPETAAEFFAIQNDFGSEKNCWLRQVVTYWEMAASLVLRGAVDPDLYVDGNGEGIFLYAKFRPFHEEYQQVTGTPFMRRTAELIQTVPAAKEAYERMVKTMATRAS